MKKTVAIPLVVLICIVAFLTGVHYGTSWSGSKHLQDVVSYLAERCDTVMVYNSPSGIEIAYFPQLSDDDTAILQAMVNEINATGTEKPVHVVRQVQY